MGFNDGYSHLDHGHLPDYNHHVSTPHPACSDGEAVRGRTDGDMGRLGCTSPTVSGDDYWYDSGTVVSLSLQGVFGRAAGTGWRMVSYSINNGATIGTNTDGPVAALNAIT